MLTIAAERAPQIIGSRIPDRPRIDVERRLEAAPHLRAGQMQQRQIRGQPARYADVPWPAGVVVYARTAWRSCSDNCTGRPVSGPSGTRQHSSIHSMFLSPVSPVRTEPAYCDIDIAILRLLYAGIAGTSVLIAKAGIVMIKSFIVTVYDKFRAAAGCWSIPQNLY
jgi:hypothetical protein